MVYRAIALKPEPQALELHYRVRHADIKPGRQSWFDGRIMMNFKDAAGTVVAPGPKHPNFRGTSKGWLTRTQYLAVPTGAALLEIMPALFQAENGTLEIDDVWLIPVASRPPKPEVSPAAATQAVPVMMKASDPLAVTPAIKTKELHVVGNQLQNADGQPVWLQGLSIASLEWSVAGEQILTSARVGLEQWKANVIRLPVSDEFWFGRNQNQKDGGAAYRKLVDAVVQEAGAAGAYVVLDLHRYRAPTDQHAEFWNDAARRYLNHPVLLFDLLNEPHDISWDVWRNGGEVPDQRKAGVVAENAAAVTRSKSLGMQRLVEVVRDTGARNIVVAGGLDWGYDLSGVMRGFALEERKGGNGIMYSSHIYPWKRDWKGKVLVAAEKHPLLIGEVGCDSQRMSFIPPDQHEDPFTWAPDMLGCLQQYHLHWTAWCFHPKASPRLLQDWTYIPTPFWGEFVKQALAGKKYEMKKMR